MTRVAVKGGSLFTTVDGADQHAPWLILSNGISTNHHVWDRQIEAFASAYRVIRYDTRGHGASDAIAGPYDFNVLIDDVEAILDHYHVERATFVGLSLGGMTGLGFGLRNPNRMDALVCCNARADAPEPFIKSWDDRIAAITRGGMETIVEGSLERWLSPSTRRNFPAAVEALRDMIRQTSPVGYKGCAEALKKLNFLKDLGSLSGRVLYVAGADDVGAPAGVMQIMADATPGARLAVVQKCAHLSNLDNPIGFMEAVSPFLSRNGADPVRG